MFLLPKKKVQPLQKTPDQVRKDRLDIVLRDISKVPDIGVLFEVLKSRSEEIITLMDANAGTPDKEAALAATLVQNEKVIALLGRYFFKK